MKKSFFFCAAVQVFIFCTIFTGCAKQDLTADSIEKAEYSKSNLKIDDFLNKNKFTGAVLIAKKDKIIFAKGYGLSDSHNKNSEKITMNSVFEIGSLTKQMTASAIMQLVEKKQLSVNDKLSVYFPDAPNADQITIDMLLKMRSGLTDMLNACDEFFPRTVYRQIEKNIYANKPLEQDLVLKYLPQSPVMSAPDSTYFYCNTNYYLLAKIVEKVSGMSFCEYIHKNIFTPAGMIHSNMDFQKTTVRGYDYKKRYYSLPQELSFGCGDVNSSVVDLYKWNRALLKGKVVSKKSYKKMIKTTSYGYGLNNQNGEIFHSGVTGVFNSYMSYYPKTKTTVIVLINEPVSNINATVISRRIYKLLQEKS